MSDADIDISVLLSPSTPVWPGDTPFSCLWTWNMDEGASVNVSAITASPHAGTHADTPLHVTRGAAASESLSIDVMCGKVTVIDLSAADGEVDSWQIHNRLYGERPERLIVRTGRTIAHGKFPESWPWLAPAPLRDLIASGLRLLGVDCPSVDARDSKTLAVHHELLDSGASVLENLDLTHVEPGHYFLTALPMKVAGLDAVPVRATLRRLVPYIPLPMPGELSVRVIRCMIGGVIVRSVHPSGLHPDARIAHNVR